MNYKSLAAHNAACNWIFHRFQDCEKEHPYRKFLGYCENIQKEMNKCIKEQREIRRNESAQLRHKRFPMRETSQQEKVDEPEIKRFKSKDDCEKTLCEQKEKNNIHTHTHTQKDVTKDISDIGEVFLEQINKEKDSKMLANSNDKTLADIDSDDESFTFPPDKDISDMLDEVQYNGYFPTVTERYFTSYYKINVQSFGDDLCIRIHSNRICMLSLAPSHVILQGDKDIKVNFKVSDKLDRSMNKVSGKGKHGAQPLQTNSNICTISCSDGQTYVIKCCMIGKLVEVNEMLSENPDLLREPPHKGGYLAIILPNIKLLESLKQSLLTHKQYTEFIKEREKEQEHIE